MSSDFWSDGAGNSRHRQHFLCGGLSNYKLIQILHKLENVLRKFLCIDGDAALLDEGLEVQTSERWISRALPRASKHISPAS
jgi:hypothetical protein